MMKSCFIYIILILMTALYLQCAGGGGTDIESSGGRLTGSIIDSKGLIARDIRVQLISQTSTPFSKDTIYGSEVNDSGRYSFTNVDSGMYNLEALSLINGTRLLLREIHISAAQETIMAPGTLRGTGSIIIYCDSLSIAGNSYVFIPGTSIQKQLQSPTDSIRIDSVPAGVVPPILYADFTGGNRTSLTDTLHIIPTETLKVYGNWTYSKNIFINPAAQSISDVSKFPLLIRLDSTNFDFSQASSTGKDLRFTRNTTISLPYEIERWDSLQATAVIWVLLDSIKSNIPSQFITMSWGNPAAKKVSNGPDVFDTSDGFRAVLHINQESSGVKNHNLYQDASGMANHGDDYIADRARDGIIGYGKHFNFSDEDYILIDTIKGCNFGSDPFTISLWFKSDDKQNCNLFTFYFGESDTTALGVSLDTNGSILTWCSNDTLLNTDLPPVNTWTHFVLTRSVTQQLTMFINGTAIKSVSFPKNINTKTCGMFFIGSDINMYPVPNGLSRSFNGNIDEFRIEGKERSADYIKLMYLSQRITPFISFGK